MPDYVEYLKNEYLDDGDYGGFYQEFRMDSRAGEAQALKAVRRFRDDHEKGLDYVNEVLDGE